VEILGLKNPVPMIVKLRPKKKLFSWLDFEIIKRFKEQSDTSINLSTNEIKFEIKDDLLRLAFETQKDHERPFYNQVDKLMINRKSYDAIINYKKQTRSYLKVASQDVKYYNENCRKMASKRNANYYRSFPTGKITLSNHNKPCSDYVVKKPKSHPKLVHFIPIEIKRESSNELMMSENLESYIDKTFYDLSLDFYDSIDLLSLIRLDASMEFIQVLSSSKIYVLLNLFRKASESISFGCKSGSAFSIDCSLTSLSLHIYISGSVMQTDKGIAYVSLVNQGQLIKTWAWRSSDIKYYKTASSRLIASSLSAWKHIHPSKRLRMFNLYSMIILENSWGDSCVLKPFRYLVTGFSYKSPMVYQQIRKFSKEMDKMSKMCENKMSLTYIDSLLSVLSSKEELKMGSSPLLNISPDQMGYEAFLMNLCPSSTYGKRKHKVDVLKELVLEIELSNAYQPAVKRHFSTIHYLINYFKENVNTKVQITKLFKDMLVELDILSNKQDGRFTMSPISLLIIYPEIKQLNKTNFMGTVPRIQELMTMKSAFDPINFKDGSALESIASLVAFSNLTTVPLIAVNLLRNTVDLTFKMFDKDQIGGNREISQMSSEFRILQSITESFSKRLGYSTGIDMLDNPAKLKLLGDAQNECNEYKGLRETVDQTRWGPNFCTSIFGYMFSLFLRHTTEALMPMICCFLSEFKTFQMLPYPELSNYQLTGTTLAGIRGAFHMGQGIFHYTSSLYHSLVHSAISKLKRKIIIDQLKNRIISDCIPKSFGIKDLDLVTRTFITSDDVAIITYAKNRDQSENKCLDDTVVREVNKLIIEFSKIYPNILQVFCIKTSDYKNMISYQSFEFNSIFLNESSVGSNSLKFLNSLIDPFTSGNQLRDIRKIFDVYIDGLNSGLSPDESLVCMIMNMKTRLLQWGSSSDVVMSLIDLFFREQSAQSINKELFPIECTTQTMYKEALNSIKCNTVLPYRNYSKHEKSMSKFSNILSLDELIYESDLKKLTLSKSKERRLGSNRGLVLSKKLRDESRIILPITSESEATHVSGPAILAYLIHDRGELLLTSNDDGYILRPTLLFKTLEKGFQMKRYKTSDFCGVSMKDLLYSSYRRVPYINSSSSSLETLLHIGRKHCILKISEDERIESMNYNERLIYFDEIISTINTSGSASQLIYSEEYGTYESYHFPLMTEALSFVPNIPLLKTSSPIDYGYSAGYNIYFWDLDSSGTLSHLSTEYFKRRDILASVFDFTPTIDDFTTSAISLLKTDKQFKSRSSNISKVFINFSMIIRPTDEGSDVFVLEDPVMGETKLTVDEMRDMFLDAFREENFDFDDLMEAEPKVKEKPDDPGFFSLKNMKIKRIVFSFEVDRYVMLIQQPFFRKMIINNGMLFSMIRQGFVHNVSKSSPEEILYSIMLGERENTSDLSLRVPGRLRPYKIRLMSLFSIQNTVDLCSKKTVLESFKSSYKERLRNLVSLCESPDYLKIDLLMGLPGSIRFSDQPLGVIRSLESFKAYVSDFKIENLLFKDDYIKW